MSEFIFDYIEHCRNCNVKLGLNSFQQAECYECYTSFSSEQRAYAEQNPRLYEKRISLANGESKTVIEQAEYMDLKGRILNVFGCFAITERGIECLTHEYFIEKSTIHESHWVSHMSEKRWVILSDFKNALAFARANL